MTKGDSAASSHCLRKADKQCIKSITRFNRSSILLLNNLIITTNKKGLLPLSSNLLPNAQTVMILPNLKSASLISIGQLCDDNCNVILNKRRLIAIKIKSYLAGRQESKRWIVGYSGSKMKNRTTQLQIPYYSPCYLRTTKDYL